MRERANGRETESHRIENIDSGLFELLNVEKKKPSEFMVFNK